MKRRMMLAAIGGATAGALAFALFVAAAVRVQAPTAAELAKATAEAEALAASEGFAVWGRQDDGTPVRWNPCEPIPYVLDDRLAPVDARATLAQAAARISAATGLQLVSVGDTTEAPGLERPLTVAGPDGLDWAPVLITWVPGNSTDLPLGDDERGVTVPVAVRDGGPRVFVTGQIVLNADKSLLPAFEDRHAAWGAVLLHELGHLVGLDHVQDARELMHPTPGFGPVVLGEGDRAGLSAVGADGGCLTTPDPQELTVDFG